jgi:hypothetical protein
MLATVDDLLRARGRHAVGGGVSWRELLSCLIGGGLVYGAVMGSFGLKPLQGLYSAIKVPLLLGAASVVCLPSFFVINTLLGLRSDFGAACRGLLTDQATLAIVLASLSPLTAVAYASSADYRFAVLWNGLPFLIATLGAQTIVARHDRPLEERNPRHRFSRNAWIVLYIFVTVQLAWVLRPFAGSPGLPSRFFREDAWSNAYVVTARALADFVAGR